MLVVERHAKEARVAKTSRKKTAKRSTTKRELIDTGTDKRFVKRASDGTWSEMDDVGPSLGADQRRAAKNTVTAGYGDQGDQRRVVKKAAKKR